MTDITFETVEKEALENQEGNEPQEGSDQQEGNQGAAQESSGEDFNQRVQEEFGLSPEELKERLSSPPQQEISYKTEFAKKYEDFVSAGETVEEKQRLSKMFLETQSIDFENMDGKNVLYRSYAEKNPKLSREEINILISEDYQKVSVPDAEEDPEGHEAALRKNRVIEIRRKQAEEDARAEFLKRKRELSIPEDISSKASEKEESARLSKQKFDKWAETYNEATKPLLEAEDVRVGKFSFKGETETDKQIRGEYNKYLADPNSFMKDHVLDENGFFDPGKFSKLVSKFLYMESALESATKSGIANGKREEAARYNNSSTYRSETSAPIQNSSKPSGRPRGRRIN